MTVPSATNSAMSSRTSSGVISPPQKVRSRAPSMSSDRPSTTAHSLMSPPLSVSPEAAFIAASAASQIVTNDHDSHADAWYDQHGLEPSGETASVSPAALQLVNNFLDQLLFNFLSVSRATTLTALRPAVSEVLKPKLAKDAINQADEELREYLGGGDDEDIVPTNSAQSPRDWDLELVWKRTRLRCMVYSSLGDMEEEDEDYHMEQEHLGGFDDEQFAETVSPAVAIFLTSILEFMGEQALIVAGQAAYHRMRAKYEKDLKEGARSPAEVADRIVLEELDMERVALDRTLGRLWRAWKKRIRSPAPEISSFARAMSRDSLRASALSHARQGSISMSADNVVPETVPEKAPAPESQSSDTTQGSEPVEEEPLEEYLRAAAIPIPVGDREIAEILIPGLAYYSDDEEEVEEDGEPHSVRPKSMMIMSQTTFQDLPTPTTSQPHTPLLGPSRKRANSLPTPASSPYKSRSLDPMNAEGPEPEVAEEQAEERDDASPATITPAETQAQPLAFNEEYEVEGAKEMSARVVPAIQTAHVGSPERKGAGDVEEHTEIRASLDGVDDFDEFAEEPQILTSARVSMSGRSSSPSASEGGRPLSINPLLPTRSGSVHSLKIIEVQSPRSPNPINPISRSRGSSFDTTEHKSGNVSRASSISVNERRKTAELVPNARASMMARSPTSESISEAEEVAEPIQPLAAVAPSAPEPATKAAPESKRAPRPESVEASVRDAQPIFGSAATRPISPPRSPAKPTTKVTILSSTTSNGTFFIDEPPRVPEKAPRQVKPPSPPLPERSSSRQSPITKRPVEITAAMAFAPLDRPRTRNGSPDPTPAERSSPARSLERPPSMRPHHGAGSSISSTNKFRNVRASEDSTAMRPEDVARNFEELIQSDQTIQYTLTPESMRDIDSTRSLHNESPVVTTKSRKSEDAKQNSDRSRSSSVNRPADVKRTASVSRAFGLTSHPVPQGQAAPRLNGPVPRAPPNMPSSGRANGPQARDAKVPGESLKDLAEFIRATGPTGVEAENPRMNGANRAAPSRSGSAQSPSSQSKTSLSSANRPRYQARDATVDYKDDNSDLIDFIRRGPPSTANNPRIPRTVAPFRTTMDSDQLQAAVGGKAVDATLPPIRNSTAATSVNTPSVQSSINSSSALLKNSQGNNPGGGNAFDSDMPMPQRKTRRVRDPYAIDFSDEEEAEDEDGDLFDARPPPKKPQRQEESLMDFLRNVPPPPEPAPSRLEQQMRQVPKKKASAPSLIMARFARRESGSHASSSGKYGSGGGETSPGMPPQTASRSLNSRAGTASGSGARGYVPIQVNMPASLERFLPGGNSPRAASTPSPSLSLSQHQQQSPGLVPPSRSSSRTLMKRYEPRDAHGPGVHRSATSDLADFLKNSGPPEGFAGGGGGGPMRSPREDEVSGNAGGSFSRRMFGARRKKSSLA
ncbi:uncharacterized protein E0L32_003493 [Thyridium curvatum]|uniref:Flo11 n=1 Tax=Thyridium curvatum TaxID=1093900 RepID=A0A507BIT5_9PEZI|nr:uncharacterized protein E0L32_003493 [Thyridium curvatum]TPX16931.1 hypothetical protein E0L32_003493 [Thyridium curvatum]